MSIQKIITYSILLLLVIGSISLGLHIRNSGKDTTDFCYHQYRNSTFMDKFYDNEPYELKICASAQWRSGKMQYCNSTCFEQVDECYKNNATKEDIKFVKDCGWMETDYLILLGTIVFIIVLPLMFIITIIIGLFASEKN